jgi:tetratricopeptide (TPR) repeat protein
VTDVDLPFVTFEGTIVFHADGSRIVSTSTLRFRSREEIERSLAAAAGEAAPAAAASPASTPPSDTKQPEQAPKSLRAPRRPHVFSLHARMLRERKGRAKRLFESGMAAFAAGRFTEAASGVRLAIAFDPWSAIYKEQFVDVLRKAHEERAQKLLKEADAALELRDFGAALRAFEEVIGYRPHDVELLIRAARLAWATGGDLHQAKEWAMSAVELDGQNAAAHRVLGQVYRAAGLDANARRELEAALRINPKDEEAQNELRAISGRPLGLRWLGGK